MDGGEQRPTRRELLAAGVTCAVLGLSGCSGGGDDGSGGDDTAGSENENSTESGSDDETNGDGNENGEEESEGVASGEVVTDTVDELEIVSHTSRINSEQNLFIVEMTLRNNGDMDTEITPGDYKMEAVLFDEGGTELATRTFNNLEDVELPAGETRWVAAVADRDQVSGVASYEITFSCRDSPLAGAYCE